ncbi:monooxygenase [Lentithecium fluviatile CBS 122367]|uniref:Monooxygenase n=1 Tax=Lentithecium fluviatile CBS 122367 TaxID=1168545 RepID=A0A6G1IEM1_9PLEO|nr:monooxygenase [Lentithecium fluviatile CBS 122367]
MAVNPKESEAIFAERFVKIICIGAGASGLLLAYKLSTHFDNYSLTIYEKNEEISGTWHENRYPGCACDVPAHNYTYSFEPKHNWSSVYAGSAEIKQYFKSFCAKYGLAQYIRLSHHVDRAVWDDQKGEWEVEVLDTLNGRTIRDNAHIVIYACGYLNVPGWPDVPGMSEYKGGLLHSAAWDESVKLEGKKVALIGSGSSAVQILPAIQPQAREIVTFIRSPIWILRTISDDPKPYTEVEKREFLADPDKLMRLRKYNEGVMNSIYSLYIADSVLQSLTRPELERQMRETLQDKNLEDALIPNWAVGCRRLAPDTGYLKGLKKPNVRVVKGGVTSFDSTGCTDDKGQHHEVDVIICATGFDTSFIPRFPIIGRDNRNLQDVWANTPSSYLGVGVADFPNFMMFLGPYSPVANGPTLASIEAQADYVLRAIDRYRTEPIHSFHPTPAAESDFTAHVATFMKKSVYTDKCRSGHKGHTVAGRVPTLWPGSTLHYLQAMQEFRGQDWDVRYTGNRFSYLGNGISHAEFDPTSDLAYYLKEEDDMAPLTRRERMKVQFRSGSQPERMLHFTYRPDVINLPQRKRLADELVKQSGRIGVPGFQKFRSLILWPANRMGNVMKRVWKWFRWGSEA